MAKIETAVNNLKINRGTYAKIQENIASIGNDELIIITDKNPPIPTAGDSGKVLGVNTSGDYELTLPSTPTGAAAPTTLKWTVDAENYVLTTDLIGFPSSGALITIVGRIKHCDQTDNKLTFTVSYDDMAAKGNGTWFTYKVKSGGNWLAGNAQVYWNSDDQLGVYVENDGWQDTTFVLEKIIIVR